MNESKTEFETPVATARNALEELHHLADLALAVHGPEYGPMMRSMILFTAYVGPRSEEGCALEWSWLDFASSEVNFKVAKFDKPRTVLQRRGGFVLIGRSVF